MTADLRAEIEAARAAAELRFPKRFANPSRFSHEGWTRFGYVEGYRDALAARPVQDALDCPDHDGEPKMWCETCEHTHIASIPEVTYACHSCGFGSWYSQTATDHKILCPGHETYPLVHDLRPVVVPTPVQDEGCAKVAPSSAKTGSNERVEFVATAGEMRALTDDGTVLRGALGNIWWNDLGLWVNHLGTVLAVDKLDQIIPEAWPMRILYRPEVTP